MDVKAIEWHGWNFKCDPEEAYSELEQIRSRNGGLKACDIVDAARSPDSPLHNDFEWNDEIAAERHRRMMAGTMITSLRVTYKELPASPQRIFSVKEVVSDESDQLTPDRITVFSSTQEMLETPEGREQLLNRARTELKRFRVKYEGLQELAMLFEAMSELEPA